MSDPNPDDIFNQMDVDSSGSISQRELADVYMEQYNLTDNVAQTTVKEIFHLLEIEQGSDVCLAESSELLTAMREVGILDEEDEEDQDEDEEDEDDPTYPDKDNEEDKTETEEDQEDVLFFHDQELQEQHKSSTSNNNPPSLTTIKHERRMTPILNSIKSEGLLYGAPPSPRNAPDIKAEEQQRLLEIVQRAKKRETESEQRLIESEAARIKEQQEAKKYKDAYEKLKNERHQIAMENDQDLQEMQSMKVVLVEEEDKIKQLKQDKASLRVKDMCDKLKIKSLSQKNIHDIKEIKEMKNDIQKDADEIKQLKQDKTSLRVMDMCEKLKIKSLSQKKKKDTNNMQAIVTSNLQIKLEIQQRESRSDRQEIKRLRKLNQDLKVNATRDHKLIEQHLEKEKIQQEEKKQQEENEFEFDETIVTPLQLLVQQRQSFEKTNNHQQKSLTGCCGNRRLESEEEEEESGCVVQ